MAPPEQFTSAALIPPKKEGDLYIQICYIQSSYHFA